MRIELPKELQIMNEVIDGVEYIYLASNLYHYDGKYYAEVDQEDVDLINDDCWEISFEPTEKGWAEYMLVEGKILPNPHKVEVPDDLLG